MTDPKIKFFPIGRPGHGGKKHKGFIKAGQAALLSHPKSAIYQKALHRHKAITTWEKAVGEFFDGAGAQSKAMDFKEGTLMVACLSKDLAYKIIAFSQRIIYILNQLIGSELVFALKVEF